MKKKLLALILVAFVLLLILIVIKLSLKSIPLAQRIRNSASANSLLAQAKEFETKSDLLAAKAIYQKLTADYPNSPNVMEWQKKAEEINIKLLFSPTITTKSVLYEIKPGDTLTKIAREYKTTTDLIMKSNNLSGDKIVPGRKIKVWTAPFSILVYKSQNTLILKTDEEIIKTYVVSTGKDNCTPIGTFKITSKLINPTWFKAGAVVAPGSPENVLGTRWMGLNLAGYGIHGTTEPQNLGKQVTQGCVRMLNQEAEELYTIVPAGTEVTIVE